MLHSYRSVRVVSWRPDLQVYARWWSQKPVPRALTLSSFKHGKLTGPLWCINYLCFFNHNPRPVILCMIWFFYETSYYGHLALELAAIDLYTPWHICYKWFEKRCEFSKENVFFSKWVWRRVVTLITFEWDDQGIPCLEEGLRWWLNWFRCEHEGLSLSPKDRFVITPYLYSYQVQPLETLWTVAWSELVRSEPQDYDDWGAPGG
jgi:hypothetical protein